MLTKSFVAIISYQLHVLPLPFHTSIEIYEGVNTRRYTSVHGLCFCKQFLTVGRELVQIMAKTLFQTLASGLADNVLACQQYSRLAKLYCIMQCRSVNSGYTLWILTFPNLFISSGRRWENRPITFKPRKNINTTTITIIIKIVRGSSLPETSCVCVCVCVSVVCVCVRVRECVCVCAKRRHKCTL